MYKKALEILLRTVLSSKVAFLQLQAYGSQVYYYYVTILCHDYVTITVAYNNITSKYFTSDMNECASSPCKNGGTCVDGINGYDCGCHLGYTGTQCEIGMS